MVQVTDEGVQQVIADLQRINAGLDQTDAKAKRTAADVDAAQGKGSALGGFLGRARAGGFLRGGGLNMGPVRVGSGGVGVNMGALGPAGAAVIGTAHALGGISEVSRSLREFADKGHKLSAGEVVEALYLEANFRAPARIVDQTLGISRTGTNFGIALGLGKESDYAGALERLDDLFKSSAQKRIENEEKRQVKAAEREARTQEEKRQKQEIAARIRAAQDAIDAETNRALSRLHRDSTARLGIRMARGADQAKAWQEVRDLRIEQKRLAGENEKRNAAKNIKNQGA